MNYSAILKRAGHVTWRYRALWLFGILLALLGGGGGGGRDGANVTLQPLFQWHEPAAYWGPMSGPAIVGFLLLLIAFVAVLVVVSIVVRYISEGALIGMVDEIEGSSATSIGGGFRTGWTRFLRLFAISLLVWIPAIVVITLPLLIVAAPLLLIGVSAALHTAVFGAIGVIGTIGLGLLWALFALAVAAAADLLLEFMYRRCVLEREGVFASIRGGYHMVRRNLREAGLMWLLLFGINLALGVVLVPVALLGLGLVGGPALLAWAATRTVIAALLVGMPLLLVFIAAAVFVGGLYSVFRSTVWTLTYRDIAGREQSGPPAVMDSQAQAGGA